ncbi:hypothetical protein M426DRAFT_180611 [Hypoxylon sp. CI-4A]|nr:hypothetical protein M426DRAFT_180611 [Hypoxylon sp. CI-4A]
MDHFPLPKGKAHLRVPNLTTEVYTQGDGGFGGYPGRMNWTWGDIEGQNSFGQRSKEDVQAFFQNWLFFGCAIEVLAVGHVKAEQADFLDNTGKYVSTRRLPHLIRKWKKVDRLGGKGSSTHIRRAMKTAGILKRVSDFVDRYCIPYPGRNVRGQGRSQSPVSDLTWTSIIALGHTLTQAMLTYYGIVRTGNHWGASPLLKRRLLANGWCPMDVERSMSDMGIDGHYYLARLNPPEDHISHSNCSKNECAARNVDKDTYEQKHVSKPGDCSGPIMVDLGIVVKIIETPGYVPVFRWDPNKKRLSVAWSQMIGRGVANPPYVTISHVWSDGIGNLKENSLLECQLNRIQRLVNDVARSPAVKHAPQHFWLDTLSVPVGDDMRPFRRKAIQNMANIYKASAATLVLSSSLSTISTTDDERDWALALYLANWNKRLWTCQEGMLAHVIMLQFADQAVSNDIFVNANV